jgi:hypothetical protein
MHHLDIYSWIDHLPATATATVTAATSDGTPEADPMRKRKASDAADSTLFNQGLSSPPLTSKMDTRDVDLGLDPDIDSDSDAEFVLDPEATPRPQRLVLSHKRQRVSRADAPPLSHGYVRAAESPHLSDSSRIRAEPKSTDSAHSTHSITTSNTGDDGGKSTGSRSPVKNVADLVGARKPVNFAYPKREQDFPTDVRWLLSRVREARSGQAIVAKAAIDDVRSSLGFMDDPLDQKAIYDANIWAVGKGGEGEEGNVSLPPIHWDVKDECKVLQKVVSRTQECEDENVSEPSWNARVHDLLLDVSLLPFHKVVSHWDVTRATIQKDYHPRDLDGVSLSSKMVDFAITLDGDDTKASVAKRLRQKGGNRKSINHTNYQPLRYRPIAISIETKAPDGSSQEGTAQLSVWAGAYMTRLTELTGTSDSAASGLGITLPIIFVRGGLWHLLLATDEVKEIRLIRLGVIGDTSTLVGCYKVVALLRWLAIWSLTTFRSWLMENALSIGTRQV